ncbi:MAG: MFS transporter, partial [Bacteroidales bacterium]
VNPMLNTLGGGGNKGNQLIQFGGSCNSIAATIAPVLGGYLIANAIGDKSIAAADPIFYLAIGIFALAFIVLYMVNIPEPRLNVVKKDLNDKHSPLSFRHFILGAIAIFIYVGIEVGIPNIANLFMTSPIEQGGLAIDTTIAGTGVGTYWFLMLVGRLVGALLGAKFSSKSMLICVSSLGLIFVTCAMFIPTGTFVSMPVFQSDISFGMAEVPTAIMFLILCGLCTSVMWGGIFNLAVEGLGKYTEAGSGIFMVMVCGGGVLPLIQGFVADKTSYMNSYWVIFAGLLFLLFYALIGSKNVNKNISVE